MMKILSYINLYGFGFLFPPLLCVLGALFAVRLRGFPLRHPGAVLGGMTGRGREKKRGGYSPFRAMMVALGGTLGVGNIVGVAIALTAGGCGAVFWMWVSAAATMLIKYAEIVLSVKTRKKRVNENGETVYYGGPMLYIGKYSAVAASVFCVLCIGASFCGNLVQMNAVFDGICSMVTVHPAAVGLFIAGVSFFLVFGGRDRIASYASLVIPTLTVLYTVLCVAVLVRFHDRIPAVFISVLQGAFAPRAVGGGVSAYLILTAMRHGMAKGVYSHEAGCGTAPIAYAGVNDDCAPEQGFLGIAEVFVDTIVLCTLTAFAVLCVYPDPAAAGVTGLPLVMATMRTVFGSATGALLGGSVAVFGFSTLICWSFYGSECVRHLFPRAPGLVTLYRMLFCACSAAAVFLSGTLIWELCDFFTVMMTVLNCRYLLRELPAIAQTTAVYFRTLRRRQSSGKSGG